MSIVLEKKRLLNLVPFGSLMVSIKCMAMEGPIQIMLTSTTSVVDIDVICVVRGEHEETEPIRIIIGGNCMHV
jgi:hypothetical protein